MRKILHYLKQHLKEDFNPVIYTSIGIFLSICILLNFTFDFEDRFLDTRPGIQRFFFFFITHAIAYYVPVGLYTLIKKESALHSMGFWTKSSFALVLLSLDRSNLILMPMVNEAMQPQLQFYASKITNNLSGAFFLIMPFLFFYRMFESNQGHRYGLNGKKFNSTPYFLILLFMIPVIAFASFLPSFIDQYPMYLSTNAHKYWGIPEWITVAGYEFSYGINFISIEFFYRGLMVIGMTSFLGRSSVLCMTSLYCFLHFGKPMGEAISSIFGGFTLGVIAYETRTIWGGVIAHIGIAWMMEIAGYVQSLFYSKPL